MVSSAGTNGPTGTNGSAGTDASAGTDGAAGTNGRTARTAGGALATAAATVIAWWAWLGHDTTYQTDPATGEASGPYEAWQVAGCVLTLVVIVIAAALVLHPLLVAFVTTASFALAWSWSPSIDDETGLWAVGAFMIVVGLGTGSAVVALATSLVRKRLARRPVHR